MDQKVVKQLEQGFQLLQNQHPEQAEKCFQDILTTHPDNEFALNLLGVTYLQLSNPKSAIEVLNQALTVNHQDPETHANLGLAFKDTHDWKNAQLHLEQSLKINPRQPVVLNNLGNVFAAQDLHSQAASCFDNALKIAPEYPECLSNFAQSLKEIGEHSLALKAIIGAQKLETKNSYFANIQGEIELLMGQYLAAKSSFNRAIALDNNIVARVNLSTALKQLGEHLQARQCLLQVIDQEPNNSEAHHHFGVLQEQLGEFEQAAVSFRNALKHTPNHASSFYQLAKLKQQSLSSSEKAKIQALLDDPTTPDVFKSSLYLALGVDCDKQRLYRDAMQYFVAGKSLKAKKVPYRADISEKYRALITQLLTKQTQGSNVSGIQPVFIIGMPRSGTSLTEQILSSHSRVFGAGELGFINDLMKLAEQETKTRYPYCLEKLSSSSLTRLGAMYKQRVEDTFGSHEIVLDKNPLNYNFVSFIRAILPDAKFIYCKRQAMDNCVSIFKLPFDDNQSYAHDLQALGHYYREHEKLMALFKGHYQQDILQIEYEQTVADQRVQTQRLLDFLGLEFEQETQEFYKTERIVMTPSAEQVRQPIYNTSIGTWQRYEELLNPLIDALAQS
ncbi:tetratricopeptide repeat-containing sulfotransferase family protein [Thalassotalea sp. PS06]|uniref:tetratricopeptide repeat-containing sulfotransferase family protein n=1 Tax=Thalassotalea sp. PS06 TaxID=2594005 RepID=UPI001164052C|nr:tetratricopeptide repeat-containing sulfotransferase family protein [Thalassotalea sp. PS06]QDP01006.1 tetratricopeptide repeat protein [Thalassotalea sp. PS06]